MLFQKMFVPGELPAWRQLAAPSLDTRGRKIVLEGCRPRARSGNQDLALL